MRKPNKARGEVACRFNNQDFILCATMEAVAQIEDQTGLAITDLFREVGRNRFSVVRKCFEALVIEGDAVAAFEGKVGLAGLNDLSSSILHALIPDVEDEAGNGDAASAS